MSRRAGLILGTPALLLIAPFLFYQHFGGVPHFLLHTLMGWDIGLLVLLAARLLGWRSHRWEGLVPVALAFWAMAPDFIYVTGPYHRDWMDIFLFHVSLDEILPYAAVVEGLLALLLTATYLTRGAALSAQPTTNQPGDDPSPFAT